MSDRIKKVIEGLREGFVSFRLVREAVDLLEQETARADAAEAKYETGARAYADLLVNSVKEISVQTARADTLQSELDEQKQKTANASSNYIVVLQEQLEETARADAEMESNHRLIARNLELENLINSWVTWYQLHGEGCAGATCLLEETLDALEWQTTPTHCMPLNPPEDKP